VSPAGQMVSQPATTAAKRAPKLLTKLAYYTYTHNTHVTVQMQIFNQKKSP
jgi:hypothetical protein